MKSLEITGYILGINRNYPRIFTLANIPGQLTYNFNFNYIDTGTKNINSKKINRIMKDNLRPTSTPDGQPLLLHF